MTVNCIRTKTTSTSKVPRSCSRWGLKEMKINPEPASHYALRHAARFKLPEPEEIIHLLLGLRATCKSSLRVPPRLLSRARRGVATWRGWVGLGLVAPPPLSPPRPPKGGYGFGRLIFTRKQVFMLLTDRSTLRALPRLYLFTRGRNSGQQEW